MKSSLCLAVLMGLMGCKQVEPPKGLQQQENSATIQYQAILPPPTAQKDDPIKITDVPADIPKFERKYVVPILHGITLTVEVKTFSSGDYRTGELTQSDGKWVSFDPDDPAEKILDRELLPIVETECRKILKMDKEFRSSSPNEFTDEHGTVWVRKAGGTN